MHISRWGIALHTHTNVGTYYTEQGEDKIGLRYYKKCSACTKISVPPLANNSTMNSELSREDIEVLTHLSRQCAITVNCQLSSLMGHSTIIGCSYMAHT